MDQKNCLNCLKILKFFGSCPSEDDIFGIGFSGAFMEIIMVIVSALVYPLCFTILMKSAFSKTTRGFFIFSLISSQNLICMILKSIYEEPRPRGACSNSFGFPSTHSAFASALLSWIWMENIYMPKTCYFKKWKYYKNSLILGTIILSLVPYSRLYLNYHTLEQVVYGVMIGTAISISTFLFLVLKFTHECNSFHKMERPKISPLLEFFENFNFYNNYMDELVIKEQVSYLSNNYVKLESLKEDLKIKRDDMRKKVDFLQREKYKYS